MRKSFTAVFKGTVQGIGFRYTTERIARRFSVLGVVKNLSDGSVRLVAEGEEGELQAFLKSVRESPLDPYIADLEVEWAEAAGNFTTFEIGF